MRTLSIITACLLLAASCGDTESKNNVSSNNTTSNNGSNNGTANNGTTQTTGNNTTPLPEPELHREEAVECDDERPPGDGTGEFGGDCETDADCADGMNGRCVNEPRSGSSYCSYDECNTDSDCGDAACVCGTEQTLQANRCIPGNCQVDADCGPGGYCSPTQGDCGAYNGYVAYYCHTPDDECTTDADCGGDPYTTYCAYDEGVGHWKCSSAQCVG